MTLGRFRIEASPAMYAIFLGSSRLTIADRPTHVSSTNRRGLTSSEPIVAYPSPTPFSGYVRVAGYSTGTKNFRTEQADEYVGDCVNSTAFPATGAFTRTTDGLKVTAQ
jgi:hypothetical protein